MEMDKKFAIGYNSADAEDYHYHIDLSVPLKLNEVQSLARMPGVDMIRESNLHVCIKEGALSDIKPIQMLEQIIAFFETIGFRNAGRGSAELLRDDLGNMPDSMVGVFLALGKKYIDHIGNWKNMSDIDPIFPKEDKAPEVKFDIRKTKRELKVAVDNEDYERAAKLRDLINEFKNQKS